MDCKTDCIYDAMSQESHDCCECEMNEEEQDMEITIFSKKRQTKDGRIFWSYLSTLTKRDGEKVTVSVKFREECGSPKPEECPMNIIFDKHEGNLSSRDFVREDTGELFTSYTLWLSGWKVGSPYEDHSLDEFF